MPTVDASKIKIRRGKNSQRLNVILEEGELGYTTDTKRVFIGDGSTTGGNSVGTKNFNQNSRTANSLQDKVQLGDIVFDNNLLYSLSASNSLLTNSWMMLSPRVDGTSIEYYGSKNTLRVVPGSNKITAVGVGLAIDTSSDPYLLLDTDTNTTTLLNVGSGPLSVGNLTNDVHGPLTYQTTSGGLHHTVATTSNPGFMSQVDKSKLDNTPDFPITDVTAANGVVNSINTVATSEINESKINFAGGNINVTSKQANAITLDNVTVALSGGELIDPFFGFNSETFPGQITTTSLPAANVSNQGEFITIQLTDFSITDDTGNDYYKNKAFLLPAFNGTTVAIFISDDTGEQNTFISTYPLFQTEIATWDGTAGTLKQNVINAINSAVDLKGYRLFEAWSSGNNLSIMSMFKGYSSTYDATFATFNNFSYEIDSTASIGYTNADLRLNPSSSSGSYSAGEQSTGKVPLNFYGWLNLNTTSQSLSTEGKKSVHSIDAFPGKSSMTNSQYFLIYDYSGKRYVVWYNIDGSGTVPAGVYDNSTYRGIDSIFIEVDLSASGDTPNATSTATLNALQGNVTFSTAYNVTQDGDILNFISNYSGLTDGILNRVGVGVPSPFEYTTNSELGSPDVSRLNGVFKNSFKVTGTTELPQEELIIPGIEAKTLIANDSSTITIAQILKFR